MLAHLFTSMNAEKAKSKVFTPQVITLIFLSFVLGTSEFIVIGLNIELGKAFGVTPDTIGILVSIFAVAYIIGTPVITAITSKLSKYKVILVLMVIFGISNALPLVSNQYWILVVSRVCTAAVSGVILSLGMAIAMEISNDQNRAPIIAWIYTGFSISSVVGMPVGQFLGSTIGWRYAFVMVLVLTIIEFAAIVITLPRDSAPAMRTERMNSASGLFKDTRVILGFLATVLSVGGVYIFFTFLEGIIKDEMGVSDNLVSVCLLIFGIACIISNIASAKLACPGGLRRLMIVFGVQALLLAVLPSSLPYAVAAMTVLFCIGLTMYLLNAPSQMHFMEVAVKDHPGSVNLASTLNPVAFNLGIAIGSFIGSMIVKYNGLQPLGYFSAIFSVLALLCVFAILVYERNPEKRTILV
jgi:DHA1 family inner membrane transport protein